MSNLNADQAAKIADLLFRYMRARYRFDAKLERPLPAHELAVLIRQSKRTPARGPIVFGGQDGRHGLLKGIRELLVRIGRRRCRRGSRVPEQKGGHPYDEVPLG